RGFTAIGARGTQEAIACEDGVERAREDRLDMHAGEIEVFRVGAGLVAGDLTETGEPKPSRLTRFVLKPDAPTKNRALGIGRDLHARFDAVQRMHDRKAVEA